MELIQWKASYELGIPSVDAEHREMVQMINDVYARLEGPPDPAAIEGVLGEIHAGIAAHFALEERVMRDAGWREFEQHKQNHEELLDAIRDLMDLFAGDPERGRKELQRELADWFGIHFRTFDARLHEWFGRGDRP